MGRVAVIAELGNNAAGDVALAQRMIDAAQACGADVVKFQAIHPRQLVGADHPAVGLLERESFRDADFAALKEHCDRAGIEFLATPFDLDGIDLLEQLGVRRYKVASGELTWPGFLRAVGRTRKPVIMSTGGATEEQVEQALGWLRDGGAQEITLLHCVSAYPPPDDELNLPRIPYLRQRFGLPAGFSDHSAGWEMAVAAIALGAAVIEKHFTIDRSLPGVDNPMSILPADLRNIVAAARRLPAALQDRGTGAQPSEQGFVTGGRRGLYAARDLPAGTVLAAGDVVALRPVGELTPYDLPRVLGKKLLCSVTAGAALAAAAFAPDGN
ncbi:MAG TPA: N-acetylneuraminate synthase family protein [bacterium]|nr:N-acetylneuraminate synthase family protein [bacterium]